MCIDTQALIPLIAVGVGVSFVLLLHAIKWMVG